MINVVAYIRVSTKGQGDSGLGLDAQRDYIQRAAHTSGWNVIGEYVDVVSGKLSLEDRPEGAKALAACKLHNAQLLVAKLDRLSRSVLHIAQLMEQVDFKVATMPQADKFQLHLFAALAQQEREFIATRTKEALASLQRRADAGDAVAQQKVANRAEAQAKGRAVADITAANNIRMASIAKYQEGIRPHLESCLYNKVNTLQSVADCLNRKGLRSPRGSEFNATAVRRLMLALNVSF
ncbi:recombinase family protein [Pseudomonas putida]|uniref:recombinase family protein n=1 Tax=Pseudomonas putida TaxID=303 RepID=UPI002AC4DF49|nr:recombinase family protein [Pseudomonas putida]MDZ5109719.1 recombinase family protein [Pseudomonas putida]